MRRLLGTLAVLALLTLAAGCGADDDGDDTASDPTPTASGSEPTTEPSTEPSTGAEWTVVALIHETAAGGAVSTELTALPDEAAVAAYAAQFKSPALAARLRTAVEGADVAAGTRLGVAVVSVGCDVPPGVTYVDGVVRAEKVSNPLPECFASVTTVALLKVAA
ncbi:MAG: hypothetical protein WKF79_03820 [Nocardioides sp.]